jgi:hypothetical protein
MPTVIDSLIVSLNLDVSAFKKGQVEVRGEIGKTKDVTVKAGKDVEESSKKTEIAIGKVTAAVVGLYALLMAGRGFKEFISDANDASKALGRFAANLGQSPQKIGELQSLVERFGGTAQETQAALENANGVIQDFLVNGKGIPEVISRMTAQVGGSVDFNHGVLAYFQTLAPILQRMNELDPAKAHNFAQALNIPDSLARAMEQYGSGLKLAMDSLGNLQPTKDQIDAATKLDAKWHEVQQHISTLGNTIAGVADGPMTRMLDVVEKIADKLKEVIDEQSKLTPGQSEAFANAGKKGFFGELFDEAFGGKSYPTGNGASRGLSLGDPTGKEISLQRATDDDAGGSAAGAARSIEVAGSEISENNPLPVRLIQNNGSGGGSFWDWLTGGSSSSSGGGGGDSGAGGFIKHVAHAVGSVLGGGDGSSSGGDYPTSSGAENLTKLIADAAKEAGIDPRIMEGIRAGESGHGKKYDVKDDSLESSWGPFQLNRRRGLGVAFERDTGLDVRNPSTIPAQAKWVANYIKQHGGTNGQWMGYHGPRDADPSWGDAGYSPTPDTPQSIVKGGADTPQIEGKGFGAGYRGDATRNSYNPKTGRFDIPDGRNYGAGAAALSTTANTYSATTSSSVNTMHVGSIAVNAPQAKDAEGIAASIEPALARHGFAQFANTGPM